MHIIHKRYDCMTPCKITKVTHVEALMLKTQMFISRMYGLQGIVNRNSRN